MGLEPPEASPCACTAQPEMEEGVDTKTGVGGRMTIIS